MSDLIRKELCGIFETKDLTKEQIKKSIKSEHEITKVLTDIKKHKYAKSDVMEKIIKNCRGVKNVMMA